MNERLVLAGDIGGTKSNLAFCRGLPDAPEILAERTYQNREFASLADVVKRFMVDTGLVAETACLGVAGAVVGGAIQLPNLGWRISEAELARDTGQESIRFINDLEANALGLPTLLPEQIFTLNQGQLGSGGNQALIAAGTGLGMAILFQDGSTQKVLASEGGSCRFCSAQRRGMRSIALSCYPLRPH